jgi:hypothetical protein
MSEPIFYPIVSHKRSGEIYRYIGHETFENIRTKQTGTVSEELASKVFWMEADLSEMVNDHPQVIDLISSLNLKLK